MYLALDIGGTKTLVATFDTNGLLKQQQRFPTPAEYPEFLINFEGEVKNLEAQDVKAVGVGAPGKIDRANGVGLTFGNLAWKDVPLEADIEKIIKAPVVIENDAKLAGLSEAIILKDEFKKVLYITFGTGIGIAFITNGVIDNSWSDSGGRYMMLEHGGKRQSWEELAAGPAITKKYGRRIELIDDPKALAEIAYYMSLGLIELIAIAEPEVIVIGGGVGAHLEKFKESLEKELKVFENPMIKMPKLVKAQRAEEAVVYGAFALAKSKYGPAN